MTDFSTTRRFQPLALRPQAIRRAGCHTPRTAGTLIGRSLRNIDGLQSRKTGVRVEARLARQPGVDHRADAGQGHTGFRHIGGQHDTPHA